MYRVKALFDEKTRNEYAEFRDEPEAEWVIEGELESFIVVSVPPTISMSMGEHVRTQLAELLRRPVLLITHNMTLMQVEQLSANEAATWIHKMEKAEQARQEHERQIIAAQIAAESVKGQSDAGVGSGSGLCVDGFGDPAANNGNGGGHDPEITIDRNEPAEPEGEKGSTDLGG